MKTFLVYLAIAVTLLLALAMEVRDVKAWLACPPNTTLVRVVEKDSVIMCRCVPRGSAPGYSQDVTPCVTGGK